MGSVLNLFHALWRQRVTAFWPVWSLLTLIAAISVAWLVRRAPAGIPPKTAFATSAKLRSSNKSGTLLVLLGLFLACYLVESFLWEDFAWYDHSTFTLYTLRGHDFAPPIWRDSGRFFPLAFQEFNLIRHFTSSIAGYHVLAAVQLLVFFCLLLLLTRSWPNLARVAVTVVILTAPAIFVSLTGLIYPERDILFWVVCLLLFVKLFERTGSTLCAVGAVLSVQVVLYYKEPVFLLVFGFVASRLIMRCMRVGRPGWDCERLRDKASILDFCLAGVTMLYALYFLAAMLPHPSMEYVDNARLQPIGIVLYYLKLDILAWVLVACVAVRAHKIWRRTAVPMPLWDGIAVGGLAYFGAYLILRMGSVYYLAPVDLIAALYLARLAFESISWTRGARLAACVLGIAILSQNLLLSAFAAFERKNVIHGKAAVADVLLQEYNRHAQGPLNLYFPSSTPYIVTEFAAYLTSRGLPVEGLPATTGERGAPLRLSGTVTKDGRCIEFREIVCHAASAPQPDSLVVLLPDDDVTKERSARYLAAGDVLLSYNPWPPAPEWCLPFVRSLHAASSRFAHQPLPDHWLHASVTLWK